MEQFGLSLGLEEREWIFFGSNLYLQVYIV
jgi:hypothetical protein